jgi:hypothetical protein
MHVGGANGVIIYAHQILYDPNKLKQGKSIFFLFAQP